MFRIMVHRSQNQGYVRGAAGLVECPIHGSKPVFDHEETAGDGMLALFYRTCCPSQNDLMFRSLEKINNETNFFFRGEGFVTSTDRAIYSTDLKARIEALTCPEHGGHPKVKNLRLLLNGIHEETEVCCKALGNAVGRLVKDEIPIS